MLIVVLALSIFLVFVGATRADDGNHEPLDAATIADLQETHLKFIAETGRIVVDEHGTRQIIWDPPEPPSLEASIRMAAEAEKAGDTDLIPLCTPEYLGYLKEQRNSGTPTNDSMFPACNAIPDKVVFGHRHVVPTSD